MSDQAVLQQMKNWGYYLGPKCHPHCPGYTCLLVAIRKKPTTLHFDPEMMELRLYKSGGQVSQAKLSLKPLFSGPQRIFPGQIVLHDRIDKRILFFAFGGSLDVVISIGETIYSLCSPAPILELNQRSDSIPDQLALELETLMARMRARWGANKREFNQRLAEVDPLVIYLASLETILTRHHQPPIQSERFHRSHQNLLHEKEWRVKTGEWPAKPPNLETLLTPSAV